MKSIVERNLPLDVTYTVINKKYIPLNEGVGTCCANCGRVISNIATVKNPNGQTFEIGFDCLETFLINNNLLSAGDIEQYEKVKKMIPKVIRVSKSIKEVIESNKQKGVNITGLTFERSKYTSDWFNFWWESSNARRTNDGYKIKEMELEFLVETLQNIFPTLTIKIG